MENKKIGMDEAIEFIKNLKNNPEISACRLTISKSDNDDWQAKLRELPIEYRDIEKLDINELNDYLIRLQELLNKFESDEPEENTEEHDDWEDDLRYIEDEIDDVESRIDSTDLSIGE